MKVYQVISAVQAELAAIGISKDSENKFDGYKFRGIDAVYNAMAPLIAKHKLCILPRIVSRTCEERQSAKGGALFYVTVQAEFDFVAAEDGSKHTVSMFGEAMDRGDKATNKAVSAAYKYACFQAFCIPTEETSADADSESHEVQAKQVRQPIAKAQPKPAAKPEQTALTVDEYENVSLSMVECFDLEELMKVFGPAWKKANQEQKAKLQAAYDKRKHELTEGATA
jgi:hypothetical protein